MYGRALKTLMAGLLPLLVFGFLHLAAARLPAQDFQRPMPSHGRMSEGDSSIEQRIKRLEATLERLQKNNTGPGFNPRTLDRSDNAIPVGHTEMGRDRSITSRHSSFWGRLSHVERWIRDHQRVEDEAKAEAAKKPTFHIGGRIHADYWGFPDQSQGIGFFENPNPASSAFGNEPENRFLFRRIRLEMRGDIFENMMWRMQVDFNNPGTPEMKDVWIGFRNLPGNHRLLIGNQKRPIGLDHLNSSRFNVFAERPLVVETFNEDARRPGITLYGNTEENDWGWASGVYLLKNISRDGRSIGDSSQASANVRLFSSPYYENDGADYFHWAVAGMFARPDGDVDPGDTNVNEGRFRTRTQSRSSSRWLNTGRIPGIEWFETLAFEAMYNAGPLQITGEYMFNWSQRDSVTPGTGPDLFFSGAYVYVSYFLTGEHMAYNRRSGTLARLHPRQNFWLADWVRGKHGGGWGAWQIAARYSHLDITDHDIRGGVGNIFELGVNWHWTSHSHVQFSVMWGDIEQHAPVGGFTDGNFVTIGSRFQADF